MNTKLGKYMSVDYGDVRTGLAATDITRTLATSLGFISESGMRHTAIAVAAKAKELGVIKIVVGLPKNMNGSEGPRVDTVRAFIKLLNEETEIPTDTIDERLTTVEAYNYMNITETASKKRRKLIDGLSAQIMLQDYIDREKRLKNQV